MVRILGPDSATGLTVAGRTDAGVHATGQVCHVDVSTDRWLALDGTLIRRLAGLLPADLRVSTAVEVPAEFDARFSALWRRYQYRVCDDASGGAAAAAPRHAQLAAPVRPGRAERPHPNR